MHLKGNPVDWQTRFRLWAALTMAVYVTGYTVYYSLGLISLDAMGDFREAVAFVWPLLWILPFAVLTHVSLGLWKLYRRNTLKIPLWEQAQILLGVCIPLFLLPYLISAHGMALFFFVRESYIYDLTSTYPRMTWEFIGMTLIIWAHAQIGIHVVLRMRPWYPRVRTVVALLFSTLPLLGIAGYIRAGENAQRLILDGKVEKDEVPVLPSPDQQFILDAARYSVYLTFPLVYAIVLGSRQMRLNIKNRQRNIEVRYRDGRVVSVFAGTTLLEASRLGNISHASICGGRGRCTTCRVRVETGMENLSPAGEREQKALGRIGAAADVRLACQAECEKEIVHITPLLPPDIRSLRARRENRLTVGTEMDLIVMFADLRGFTKMSEGRFPYDVVFILNKYFSYMGEAIEKNNGTIDKFMGDGILSYFGFNSSIEKASTDALRSAADMAEKLVEINAQLQQDLKEPLRLGISIHCGEVILGDVGYRDKTSLTIIGDTVNTASRLEHLNKPLGSQLIISSRVADLSGMDFQSVKKKRLGIRGKADPILVYVFSDILKELKPPLKMASI